MANMKPTHHYKCHEKHRGKIDLILWSSLFATIALYLSHWLLLNQITEILWFAVLAQTVYELINTIWWGVTIGIIMVAILTKIPREFVIAVLGSHQGVGGIIRATLGGVLLDLCSHGILMVGAKLYDRGASIGQIMAFLVASPWNSFSLTLVLITLIGIGWTVGFILFSMGIAVITGIIFDKLVANGILISNPNKIELPKDFQFWYEAKKQISSIKITKQFLKDLFINGLLESRMVIRWILFGVVLAGLVRAFIDTGNFQTYFGPTLTGLGLTVLVATIMEVCSEGSTPIAADILTRAKAPGNSFAFLMTGVSTDYTEIMILKDTTKSWKIALFLPLIVLPQVIGVAWVINVLTT